MFFVAAASAADSSFAVAGYGEAGASVGLEGGGLGFDGVVLAPVFLWRHGDHVLVEAELAAAATDEGLDLSLEYASIDLDFGPVLVVGLFLTPVGQFISRQHPAWINRMPDFPLPYRVGPLPMNHLGAQLGHSVRLGDLRLAGLVFADTGPGAGPSPTPTITDENLDKGVGGRLSASWLPLLEAGGSVYTGEYGTEGDRYLLWVVDAALTHEGWLDLRGEYIEATWTDARFDGAWLQVAWKLRQIPPLRQFEPVFRFGAAWGDTVEGVAGHTHGEEVPTVVLEDPSYELCAGLNYWILPNVVAKLAYTHSVETWEPKLSLQLGWGM